MAVLFLAVRLVVLYKVAIRLPQRSLARMCLRGDTVRAGRRAKRVHVLIANAMPLGRELTIVPDQPRERGPLVGGSGLLAARETVAVR